MIIFSSTKLSSHCSVWNILFKSQKTYKMYCALCQYLITLQIVLFEDIFTLSCLKFYYKYINKMLRKYFHNIQFIQEYRPLREIMRRTTPSQFPDYGTNNTNYWPSYTMPQMKKITQNISYYHLPYLLNHCSFPECVLNKNDNSFLIRFFSLL